MARNCLLISFTCLVLFIGYSVSFHFDLIHSERESQCFSEEIDQDVTITGACNVTFLHGGNSEARSPGTVKLEVTGPDKNMIVSKDYTGDSTFAFATSGSGVYTMCFSRPQHLGDGETLRVNLHYEERPTDMFLRQNKHSSAKEKNSYTDKVFARVGMMYESIEENLQRLKRKEKKFRELSGTTNSRVLWWALFQVIVLALTATWQMRHLTKFFILKKLA